MTSFANQITDALADELSMLLDDYKSLPVFKDDRSIDVGDKIDPNIADALCRSVCMLLIYTPNYLSEQKPYCATELEGMIRIENNRIALHGNVAKSTGLIITLILRGDRNELPQLLKDRENEDFSKFTLSNAPIQKNPKFSPVIQAIAKKIKSYCDLFNEGKKWCDGCDNFKLIDNQQDKNKIHQFIKALKTNEYKPDLQPS